MRTDAAQLEMRALTRNEEPMKSAPDETGEDRRMTVKRFLSIKSIGRFVKCMQKSPRLQTRKDHTLHRPSVPPKRASALDGH